MNVLVPFASLAQMDALIQAGVTEFFCGYVTPEWISAFHSNPQISTTIVSVNKRSYLNANFLSEEELVRAIQLAEQHHVRLYLTINAIYYTEPVWEQLRSYIHKVEALGIKRVIASDIGVMRYITEHTDMIISVSCLNNVINSGEVAFYRQFRIDRIVFPRHISMKNMEQICLANPDLEFEYFILSDKCIYDDGNCHCMHAVGPFCTDAWGSEFFRLSENELSEREWLRLEENDRRFQRWSQCRCTGNISAHKWRSIGCSLCSLVNALRIPNLTSLKLVGRGCSLEEIAFLVKTTLSAAELAKEQSIETVREFTKNAFGNDDMCRDYHYCIIRGYEK